MKQNSLKFHGHISLDKARIYIRASFELRNISLLITNIGFGLLVVTTAIRQQIQSLLCADVTEVTQEETRETNWKHRNERASPHIPRAGMNENALKVMFYYLFNKQTDLFIKVISLFTFQRRSLTTKSIQKWRERNKIQLSI
jgi:hypothetical protein